MLLNYQAIESCQVQQNPYPYAVIKNAIVIEHLAAVMKDFPEIEHAGSIPLYAVKGGKVFDELIAELSAEKFEHIISEKFSIQTEAPPKLITLRGQMRQKDGRIHTDSKTKLVTALMYFNENWENPNGRLRILKNGNNLDDFVEEIPPEAGTMVIFKVTDNCWHGHTHMVGKRQSIQMNYLTCAAAMGKHQFFHGLSARVKQLFS